MSSSVVELASSNDNSGDHGNDDRIDLKEPLPYGADPRDLGLSVIPREAFLRAAISLKDQVVQVTWREGGDVGSGHDPTAYTGLLGTAFICLRSYEATGNRQDLLLSSDIAEACAISSRTSSRQVTFLCGKGGIYAVGAVIANYLGDHQGRDSFLDLFLVLAQESALPVGPEEGGLGMSYDLLYGRAGFLWAALFINKYLGQGTIPNELLMPIVEAVLAGGRAGALGIPTCPLMYRWNGTRFLGAANGLAGILQVLLHFPLSENSAEDVKGTLRYMMSSRFHRSGNYPSSEGNRRDELVQWSHGATGVCITLCKASQVFADDKEFRDAAIEAGEVVWKSGLDKRVGLADGISGNSYAFLSLYRLTGETIYEERAKVFGGFLIHNATRLVGLGHAVNAYSLFQGLAGTACMWFSLFDPENSRFPGYEL
ncbi:hypothetical protein SAY86_025938 [Trapa natans]|uniref:LanC-like protein GCL1 n=1 Tax=Trapa natans TaxID=22666 RepID=A0AAN7KA00_TRANT|nr:hypothetical protein SAY86_025938 [Trapa natans]